MITDKTKTPYAIYIQEDMADKQYGINQDESIRGMVKYIRSDYFPTDSEMLEIAKKMTYFLDDRLCPYSREELRARAWLEGYEFAKQNWEYPCGAQEYIDGLLTEESFGKEVLEKFREHKGDEYLDSIESKDNHAEWTEEDEEIKNIFVDSINLLSWNNICLDNKSKRDCISWIDNIKNRIQPKQEWGEEDERMQALVNNLLWEGYKASEGENIPTWKEIVHWFKSLNICN